MVNYDGRVELRFQFSTTISSRTLVHKHSIDTIEDGVLGQAPGTATSTMDMVDHLGNDTTLAAEIDQYVALILPFYTAQTTWDFCEVWTYPAEPSQDAVYLTTHMIGAPGTGAGAADTPAAQGTFSFRTVGGGNMRCQFMEWRHLQNSRDTPPLALAEFTNFYTHMISRAHVFVGRDGTRPVALISLGHGQNEKLARKRFRE